MNTTILIIDDNEAEQFLFEHAVHKFDKEINVLKACDGREGLNILEGLEVPLDFIFLDINMPGMNGFEFLKHYHDMSDVGADIIVMLTVALDDGDHKKCMSYSRVKKVVAKPLSSDLISTCFTKLK